EVVVERGQPVVGDAGGEVGDAEALDVRVGRTRLDLVGAATADDEEVAGGHLAADLTGARGGVLVVLELDLHLAATDLVAGLLPELRRTGLERAVGERRPGAGQRRVHADVEGRRGDTGRRTAVGDTARATGRRLGRAAGGGATRGGAAAGG